MIVADLKREDGSLIEVNSRVSVEGNFGTVKFIGTLQNQKGESKF